MTVSPSYRTEIQLANYLPGQHSFHDDEFDAALTDHMGCKMQRGNTKS